jgi:peptide/nickel transport system permease protein
MRGFFESKSTRTAWMVLLIIVLSQTAALVTEGERSEAFQSPSEHHPLGTDEIGRDILRSLIRGGANSITIGMVSGLAATILGTFLGLISGYLRGPADAFLMWLCNVFFLIPALPLMIVVAAFFRPGMGGIAVCIAILGWATTARVIRSGVLRVRGMPFVLTARSMGASHTYVMCRHVLPNVMELVGARASLSISGAMLTETSISFLGLGDPTRLSWGSILFKALSHGGVVKGYVWWYLPPIVLISLTIFGFTMFGTFSGNSRDRANRYVPARRRLCREDPKSSLPRRACVNATQSPLLLVRGLVVEFDNGPGGVSRVLDNVDLQVSEREKVAIVGETGSGKSVLLGAVMRLLRSDARISGRIWFRGTSIADCGEAEMRMLRGRRIAYVPQGMGNALNPVLKVIDQVAEPLLVHRKLDAKQARRRAEVVMRTAGLAEDELRARDYPYQYSGGMKQRALIAMALASEADMLLVDEPTKGLDARKKEKLLSAFSSLESKAVVVVTHDLEFARNCAEKVCVLFAGSIVEIAEAGTFFEAPLHPFSKALLAAGTTRGFAACSRPIRGFGEVGAEPGCAFRPACTEAFPACMYKPPLYDLKGRKVGCWRYIS